MASEVQSVTNPTLSLVHGSQALTTTTVTPTGGKSLPLVSKPVSLPQDGKPVDDAASQSQPVLSLQSQVAQLNKYLNDSGLPTQFRASADDKDVEEVNPVTGEVVAQYPAAEFPALARSVGISGATVNTFA